MASQEHVGILSRTLSPSPTVRWILPARIRSPFKNDVVFVGPTYIQLREFLDNGQLADATAKLDLCTQILAAKVISAKSEIISTLDAILEQERDQERYTIKGEPVDASQPPQILLLSTADGELIYVYAKESESNTVKFVFARRPVLGSYSLPDKYGKHMAIDPESRAIAIAPSMDQCAILTLKPVDEIKSEIDKWKPNDPESFKPTVEQRFIQIDGFILKMEFLRSTTDDPTKIILVLLVANRGQTRLLLYRWGAADPLEDVKLMKCSGQVLPPEDGFPLLLIPSARFTSFVLVTETTLVLYDEIMKSKLNRNLFDIPNPKPEKRISSSSQPLMVQWAKPSRHSGYKKQNDDITMVREDGMLFAFFVSFQTSMNIDAVLRVGDLGINVDTAFCILAGPPNKGGDVIIAGGDMTNGGVFHIAARGLPKRTQTLANMAPVQDMILIEPSAKIVATSPDQPVTPSRVFVCCGNPDGEGSLVELRYGLEAQSGYTIADPDSGAIERLWTLEIIKHQEMWFFSSYALHTSLVRFELSSQELYSVDAASLPGLDFDEPTRALTIIEDRFIVQTTKRSINVFPLESNVSPASYPFREAECLCAVFDEDKPLLGTAVKTSNGFEISVQGMQILENNQLSIEHAESNFVLDHEPICICFGEISNSTLLVVGTDTGGLYGLLIGDTGALQPIFQCTVQSLKPDILSAPVTSICVLNYAGWSSGLLVCGLRNGYLLCARITTKSNDDMSLDVTYEAHHHLGSTTVSISAEPHSLSTETRAALVVCGSELRRVSLVPNGLYFDHDINVVWITNRDDPAYRQPFINAIHRIPKLRSDGDLGGLLVCASKEEISISSLIAQPQSVMRHVPIRAHPKRIAFSRYLNKIIIGVDHYINPEEADFYDNLAPFKADSVRPGLQVIEPDFSISGISTPMNAPIGDVGERIRALINWTPTDGIQHYEMIVVNLERDESGSSKTSGRIVCVSAKNFRLPTLEIKPRMIAHYPGKPITALCASGMSSLAIGVGNEIILHNLDVGSRKWSTIARYTLPSAAFSLSSQGSLIFAATEYHSVVILKENKTATDPRNALLFHSADRGARNTTNIVAFESASAIVTALTNQGTNILAFADDTNSKIPQELFDASIPLIIDRIRKDRNVQTNGFSHHHFHACTADGTLYHFETLREEEWKLLNFLESLCNLKKKLAKKTSTRPIDRSSDRVNTNSPSLNPSDMHVQGDVLLNMIEPGPYNLHNLLQTQIKSEDGVYTKDEIQDKIKMLRELSASLVNPSDDIVGSVSAWLRKLLRYPWV